MYQGEAPNGTPQIFVLEDGRTRQLTHMRGEALEPTWSPDGSQIAFAARSRGREARNNMDIFAMDADGGHLRRLAGTPQDDHRPDWSPDGSQIVFDDYGRLWVVSVEDGEVTPLGPTAIAHGHGPAGEAKWSPDGEWIAFTRSDPGSTNLTIPAAHLWVMGSDGTGERRLHPSKRFHGICQLDANWSRDGSSIAFIDGSPSSRIGIIEVQTRASTHLSTSLAIGELSWGTKGFIVSVGHHLRPASWYLNACP